MSFNVHTSLTTDFHNAANNNDFDTFINLLNHPKVNVNDSLFLTLEMIVENNNHSCFFKRYIECDKIDLDYCHKRLIWFLISRKRIDLLNILFSNKKINKSKIKKNIIQDCIFEAVDCDDFELLEYIVETFAFGNFLKAHFFSHLNNKFAIYLWENSNKKSKKILKEKDYPLYLMLMKKDIKEKLEQF